MRDTAGEAMTLFYGCASVDWPARTYFYHLCADAGCSLEDFLEAMDDKDGGKERVGKPVLAARLDDDDDDDDDIFAMFGKTATILYVEFIMIIIFQY